MPRSRVVALALITSVALAGLATVGATGASGSAPASVQPRNGSTPPASAYAIIKTVVVGYSPKGVAVNSVDDTVYVTNYGGPGAYDVATINGKTMDDTAAVDIGKSYALGVAVNQQDDSAYVTSDDTLSAGGLCRIKSPVDCLGGPYRLQVAVDQNDDTIFVVSSVSPALFAYRGGTFTLDDSTSAVTSATGVAIDDVDDSVYVTQAAGPVKAFRGNNLSATPVNLSPSGHYIAVAVNQADDTVYAIDDSPSNQFQATPGVLRIWKGSDPSVTSVVRFAVDDTDNRFNIAPFVTNIAVDQNDDTVYVSAPQASRIYIMNGRNTDDSDYVYMNTGAGALAVDDTGYNRGFIYSTSMTGTPGVVAVIAPGVSATKNVSSGSVSTPVTITVDVPNIASSFDMAANTISSVKFGATNGTSLGKNAGTSTWTVYPPAGSGTVDVTVTFNGNNTVLAGTFTYTGSPTPPPVYPPGAPTNVTAVAGSAEASVSWTAPTYAGSYPITDYEVVSSPGSKSCLAKSPALSCTVTGLSNGTSYTFTARALNGAGWGAYSEPSNAVTPSAPVTPSIMVAGSRDAMDPRIIRVAGESVGLVGRSVTPYLRFPGETAYQEGFARPTIGADGSFAWQRQTKRKLYVYFTSSACDACAVIRSNRLIIPAP